MFTWPIWRHVTLKGRGWDLQHVRINISTTAQIVAMNVFLLKKIFWICVHVPLSVFCILKKYFKIRIWYLVFEILRRKYLVFWYLKYFFKSIFYFVFQILYREYFAQLCIGCVASLWKLNCYGIRGVVHSWFASYLENRTQFTSVNGYDSNRLPMTCGGPLLFLIYINDTCRVVSGGKIKLFADDTNIYVTGKTLNQLEEEANERISLINRWLTANKLHLNMEKTCYTVFWPTKIKSN